MPPKEKAAGTTGEERKPIVGLGLGRIVHYVLDKPLSAGETAKIRPAMVVHVNDPISGSVNLQVFVDGTNDGYRAEAGTAWKTSRLYSEGREPGTWHWPAKG